MAFNDFWHNLMVKLHLNGLTDKIDKYFPSWLLFLIIIAIIIGIIIYLSLPNETNVTFQFYSDSSLVKDNLDVTFTINSQAIRKTTTTGSIELKKVKNGSKVNVRLDNLKYSINKDFVISTNLIKVNLEKKSDVSVEEVKYIRTAILLMDAKQNAFSDPTPAELVCPNGDINTITITRGVYLFDKDIACNPLRINIDVNGFVSVNKICTQTKCEILMQRLGLDPNDFDGQIEKNNLTVYVKNFSDGLVGDAKVELLDFVNVMKVIDYRQTNAMGFTEFKDLARGKYKLRATKDSLTKTVDVEITAGSPITSTIKFDKLAIGSINLNIVSEDAGVCKGKLYYFDALKKPLGSFDVNCNSVKEIAVFDKGLYKFDLSLNPEYEEKYVAINDFNVNYDQNSGLKEVKLIVAKVNVQTSTKLNIMVLSEEQQPLPNVDVFLQDALTKNIQAGYGTKKTNAKGQVTFPAVNVGTYEIRAKNDFFNNENSPTPFAAIEHRGMSTIYEEDLNVIVYLGKATITVSAVDEYGEKLEDYTVKIFKNDKLINTRAVDTAEQSSFYDNIAYNRYYVIIEKDGYLSYMSQNAFLIMNDELIVNAKLYRLDEHTRGDIEVKFLGVYNDVAMSSNGLAERLDSGSTYFYGFEVLVPVEAVADVGLNGGNLYFNSVIGNANQEETYLDVPFIIDEAYGPHSTLFYKQFKSDSEFADDGSLRQAKYSVTKTKISDAILYNLVIRVKVKPDTASETPLVFLYNITDSNSLPTTFNRKVYYANTQFLCSTSEMCLTAYYKGKAYSNGNVQVLPGWNDINYSILLKNGSLESKFAHYVNNNENNGPVLLESELNKLPTSELYYRNQAISYYQEMQEFPVYSKTEINIGPKYFLSIEHDFTSNDKIEFDQQLKLMEGTEGQNLQFQLFSVSENKGSNLVVTFASDHKIIVKGLPDNNYLVPEIENKLKLEFFTEEDVPISNDISLRYLVKEKGHNNYTITEIPTKIVKSGVEFILPGQDNNTEVRLEFEATGADASKLAPAVIYMTYTTDLFEIGSERENIIEVRVPSSPVQIDSNFVLYNKSSTDFKIQELVDIILVDPNQQVYYKRAVDWDALKLYFSEQEKILRSNTGLEVTDDKKIVAFTFKYKEGLKFGLDDLGPLKTQMIFKIAPNDGSDYYLNLIVPITFDFKYDNAPIGDLKDCLSFAVENLEGDSIDGQDNGIVFLNSGVEKFKVVIRNTCENESQKSNYKFDKLLLQIESNRNLPLALNLECINCETIDTHSSDLFDADAEFNLANATKHSDSYYEYAGELVLNLGNDSEKQRLTLTEGDTLIFKLLPVYRADGDFDSSLNDVSVNVEVNDYGSCIDFNLDEGKIIGDDDSPLVSTDFLPNYHSNVETFVKSLYYRTIPGEGVSDKRFIRMPYEFKSIRNPSTEPILGYGEQQNDGYLLKDLPFLLQNNCGKGVNYYLKIKQGSNEKKYVIDGERLTLQNTPKILYSGNNQRQSFYLQRYEYKSGAVRVMLYDSDNDLLLKELFINVQSSLGRAEKDSGYFVIDPFAKDSNDNYFQNMIDFFDSEDTIFTRLRKNNGSRFWVYEHDHASQAEDVILNIPYFMSRLALNSENSSEDGLWQMHFDCLTGDCSDKIRVFLQNTKVDPNKIARIGRLGFVDYRIQGVTSGGLNQEQGTITGYLISKFKLSMLKYNYSTGKFTSFLGSDTELGACAVNNEIYPRGEGGPTCSGNNSFCSDNSSNCGCCGGYWIPEYYKHLDYNKEVVTNNGIYPIDVGNFDICVDTDCGLAKASGCKQESNDNCIATQNPPSSVFWSATQSNGFFNKLNELIDATANYYLKNNNAFYIIGFGGVMGEFHDEIEATKVVLSCPAGYKLVSVSSKSTPIFSPDTGYPNGDHKWYWQHISDNYNEQNDAYYMLAGIAQEDGGSNCYVAAYVAGAGYCVKEDGGVYRNKVTLARANDWEWVVFDTNPTNNDTTVLTNVESCMGGGITGPNAAPKITYNDTPNCDITNAANENYDVCDVSKFSQWLTTVMDKNGSYQVALMSDSYNKETIQKINTQFLARYKEFDVLGQNGSAIKSKLDAGIYHVEILDKKVYLWQLYGLPINHIFYKMPWDGGLDANGYGTSTEKEVKVTDTLSFNFGDTTKTPAFYYDVQKQEVGNLPYVMKVEENETGGLIIKPEEDGCIFVEDITGQMSNKDYSKMSLGEKNYWNLFVLINKDREEKVYNYNSFLDVKQDSGFVWIKKSREFEGKVYFVYTKDIDGLPLNCVLNLDELYKRIEYSQVCYRSSGRTHEYYWNITRNLLIDRAVIID